MDSRSCYQAPRKNDKMVQPGAFWVQSMLLSTKTSTILRIINQHKNRRHAFLKCMLVHYKYIYNLQGDLGKTFLKIKQNGGFSFVFSFTFW